MESSLPLLQGRVKLRSSFSQVSHFLQTPLPVKAVTDTTHADQEAGLLGIFFQLVAEMVNVRVDNPVCQDSVTAPGLLEQIIDRNDLATVLEEDPQQLKFHGSQIDLFASPQNLKTVEIYGDVAETVDSAEF